MMKKGLFLLLLLWLWMIPAEAAYQPQYSVAGFYPLDDTHMPHTRYGPEISPAVIG